jgi:hypothetical protein
VPRRSLRATSRPRLSCLREVDDAHAAATDATQEYVVPEAIARCSVGVPTCLTLEAEITEHVKAAPKRGREVGALFTSRRQSILDALVGSI